MDGMDWSLHMLCSPGIELGGPRYIISAETRFAKERIYTVSPSPTPKTLRFKVSPDTVPAEIAAFCDRK